MSTVPGETKPRIPRRMCYGLVQRREACCLTWRGRLLIAAVLLLLFLGCVLSCAPFLSQNQHLPAQVLIVEGWLPDYALKAVAEEFQRGTYRYVITTGGPLLDGYYLSGAKTSADLAAATLTSLGLATNLVVSVPAPPVLRERSLANAKAVHEWIRARDPGLRSVNVYSLGVHARRSRLLFRRVLDGKIEVGVIAHPDAAYDLHHWWKTSEGFRTVTEEALGYLWGYVFGRP